MHKYLKKLGISICLIASTFFVTTGFVKYLSLDWKIDMETEHVSSMFSKFKHIKYPLIFSGIENIGELSADAKILSKNINKQTKQILKIYKNASSLFYLDYLPIKPIEKKFKPIDPIKLAQAFEVEGPSFSFINGSKDSLSLEANFKVDSYNVEASSGETNWSSFYSEIGLEDEILSYTEFFDSAAPQAPQEDLVKLVQSSTKKASKDPTSKETDDLVFFSYQEKEKEEDSPISSAVMKAIERELKAKKVKKIAAASAPRTVGGYVVTTPERERSRAQTKYKAKRDILETEVITIGVLIDKGVMDQVSGIEFIPHYDKNERIYDEAEGVLRLTGNDQDSNYIYGTLLGKDFVNMRTAIPLYLGGGMFEVPLLEKDALNKLLDKENLNGLGSHLLIDLGDSAIDVDIDKKFEARTFLSDDFKLTTQEGSYKYVLYIGVEPGNAVVRYLDSKGSTFEKLTFLADSELTFEFYSKKDPYSFKFETFEVNPLSKKAKELNISSKYINKFGSELAPKQMGLNSFIFNNYGIVDSSNSYLEFNHLGDSIFAGMRFSNYVILPSASFITSILNAEGVDSLDNHCMIQLNLSEPVKNVLYDGEDRVGPMEVKLHFLDEDGVLSEEPSLLTKHAFLFGSGQGVVNMQIEFLNGRKLVAQSFCSSGTYLVEQL